MKRSQNLFLHLEHKARGLTHENSCYNGFVFLNHGVLILGIVFPKGSTVYIGIIKENFSGYATSTDPLNITQCIVYYLLPAFVLGIVPLLIFAFDKENLRYESWKCKKVFVFWHSCVVLVWSRRLAVGICSTWRRANCVWVS
ncbi:MAG: DUF3267 domain-containing protein [Lachnospiraceae bacterium]|nr:DUF3267 domain-containing protein [Lachnospiraceae bacterium]